MLAVIEPFQVYGAGSLLDEQPLRAGMHVRRRPWGSPVASTFVGGILRHADDPGEPTDSSNQTMGEFDPEPGVTRMKLMRDLWNNG